MPGDGDDRFLHGILGLLIRKAGLDGDTIDQLPVSVKEILPAFLVLAILQPAQQAVAGRNQFFAIQHINAFISCLLKRFKMPLLSDKFNEFAGTNSRAHEFRWRP